TFIISHLVPGDPVQLAAGPQASRADIERLRAEYGLEQPLPVQYVVYVSNLLRGDWGRSVLSRRPVAEDLRVFFPATLELVIAAMLSAIALGIPLGILSAVYRDRWPDNLSRIGSLAAISLPRFFLALLLQLAFAMSLALFPLGGRFPTLEPPPQTLTGFILLDSLLAGSAHSFALALQHMLLPAFALSLSPLATITRMMRASVLEALQQDYVLTERALGLPMRLILFKYVFKNAFISTLTIIGLYFGFLLGGSVLVETVFDWPGIGLYATKSVLSLDFQPIMGVTLLIGITFVLVNLVIDVLYGVFDPRIRYA
ncbi:MAG TPA: ABC transporter permease, partial [Candidatus Eremiobacteraceae bacterium]|nr:ABC transporter permease [Candidatus Eremiobacteraceae bacterium]